MSNNNNVRVNKTTRIGKYHNNHPRFVHVFNNLPTSIYSIYTASMDSSVGAEPE
jgi:hypothetical protein